MVKLYTIIILVLGLFNSFSIVHAQTAVDLIVEGNELFAENKCKEALEKYRQSVKLENDGYLAYHGMGLAFLKLNEYDSALVCFRNAVKCNKSFEKGYFYSGIIRYNQKKYTLAIADLDKVLELNRKNYDAMSYRAKAFNLLGYYINAAKDFKHLAYKNDTNRHYYLQACIALSKTIKWKDALYEFDHLIELNPDFDSAYYFKGLCLAKNDSIDLSIEYLTKAIEKNKSFTEAYIHRGRLIQKKDSTTSENDDLRKWKVIDSNFTSKKLEQAYDHFYNEEFYPAIYCFRDVIAADSNNIEACYSLAKCYRNVKSLFVGTYYANLVITKDPQKWDAHLIRAQDYFDEYVFISNSVYYRDNKYYIRFAPDGLSKYQLDEYAYAVLMGYLTEPLNDSLMKITKMILKNDPMNYQANLLRASMFLERNENSSALDELDDAVEKNPDPSCLLKRIDVLTKLKKYDKALKDVEELIKLEGDKLHLKVIKAGINYLKGETDLANKLIESIWDYDNERSEIFHGRGVFYLTYKKDYHSAIRDFTSALEIDPYLMEAYKLRSDAKYEIDDELGGKSDWIKYTNFRD